MSKEELMGEGHTLEQAVQELERRKRADPLKNVYDPNKYQEEAHRSRAPTTLVVGANRTGKSYMAVAEALLYCLGRSTYAETPEPPNRVWYVVPTMKTWTDAGGIKEEVFEELCPWEKVVEHRKREHIFKFENGSTLAIKSTDQRQKRVVGASIDLVVADEPMPKIFYDELQARVIDKGGRLLMVFTPVGEKADQWMWIRDQLYIPSKTGERGDVETIHMPMVDDEGEPAVPHLTQEQVDQFARNYPDPQVRAARMYGEFVSRAGLVFSSYDPETHEIPRFEVPDHFHEYLVCDPQYHRFAVLHFAVDDDGRRYVVNEYFSQDETLARRAEHINGMVDVDEEIPMYVDYANPQDMRELNYHFNQIDCPVGAVELPFTKRVEKMVLRTHSMLEPSPERQYPEEAYGAKVYGAPRLMFFDDIESVWEKDGQRVKTSRLKWELSRLTWGNNNKPDKDSAGGADCTDCLIYGCAVTATGRPQPKEEEWKKGLSELDVRLWELEEEDRRRRRRPDYQNFR